MFSLLSKQSVDLGRGKAAWSARWKGGGDSGRRWLCRLRWGSTEPRRPEAQQPLQDRPVRSASLPRGSRGSRPLQPGHTSCPELSAAWPGDRQAPLLASVLSLGRSAGSVLQPACSASPRTCGRVCMCVCVNVCARVWNTASFPTYILTCVLLLFSFLPPLPIFFLA